MVNKEEHTRGKNTENGWPSEVQLLSVFLIYGYVIFRSYRLTSLE